MSSSLLAQISKLVTVDVDSMDPAAAARHTPDKTETFFCDMTSNQAITYGMATRPEQADLLRSAIDEVRAKGVDTKAENFAQEVIDVFTVLLGKQVYPYLKGNVHAQTSPYAAYDVDKTVEHAKKLVGIFEEHGIPRSRVCIKIPTTAESMVACHILKGMEIQTLATCLFSVPQALAASQAGCIYVAPYFNELRVHFEPTVWREFENPGKEHPMSQVIFDVVDVYKKIGSKTLVMPASIVTPKEVIGLVSLNPDHITISAPILDKLAELPPVSPEAFKSELEPSNAPSSLLSLDYLADGGKLLKDALAQDKESTRKLDDALSLFDDCEKKTKEFILTII